MQTHVSHVLLKLLAYPLCPFLLDTWTVRKVIVGHGFDI